MAVGRRSIRVVRRVMGQKVSMKFRTSEGTHIDIGVLDSQWVPEGLREESVEDVDAPEQPLPDVAVVGR